jgi:hypothetical protein
MNYLYLILLSLSGICLFAQDFNTTLYYNPYANINWMGINQYKANLHTHTTHSDGSHDPHEVIDFYYNANYKILALSDHNLITYPWTKLDSINPAYENRDPVLLDMLDIQGNELSASHHTGSLINSISGNGANLDSSLHVMDSINSLGIFYHPGRYWKIDSIYQSNQIYSPDWYVSQLQNHPKIAGLEVHNQGNRCPNDRILWDILLLRMLPNRNIWGFSNDDMHYCPDDCFKSYNIMLMGFLNLQDFKNAINNGAFFFAYEENGDGNSLVPSIDSIVVNEINKSISLYANNYTKIHWISGIEGSDSLRKSKIIDSTVVFYYDSLTTPYVRAEIINQYGKLYTQPFSFCIEYRDSLTDTICSGDSLILNGKAYHQSGVYYDTLQSIYQCDSIIKLKLFVHPLPSVQFSGLDSFYCVYHAVDSLIGNPSGGIFSGQGISANYFNPADAGIGNWEILYQYTDSNSCINIAKKLVIVDECLQINAKNRNKTKIFPNPSSGEISIEVKEKSQLAIFNLLGSVVFRTSLEKNQRLVNLSHLPNGIYLVKLESAAQIEKHILIIQD